MTKENQKVADSVVQTLDSLVDAIQDLMAEKFRQEETPQFDIYDKQCLDKFLIALLKIEDAKIALRHLGQMHSLVVCGNAIINKSDCEFWQSLNAKVEDTQDSGASWWSVSAKRNIDE